MRLAIQIIQTTWVNSTHKIIVYLLHLVILTVAIKHSLLQMLYNKSEWTKNINPNLEGIFTTSNHTIIVGVVLIMLKTATVFKLAK